jgi:hypothetical protein
MFCAPEHVFDGTEGVGSRFHVLLAETRFRRYRGRRLPLSYFSFLDSFSAVRRVSSPVFMFCTPGLVFGGTSGIGSRFHVLRSRTRFRRYRGHRVPFPRFASGLVFGGTEGVESSFHVLRSRTHFRRYLGRRVTFLAGQRASCRVFMFCAPGHVFSGTEDIRFRFNVLHARTHF